MAKKKALSRTASGAFVRNLGWKITESGYTQHKFHLGRDEVKAALARSAQVETYTLDELGTLWEYAQRPGHAGRAHARGSSVHRWPAGSNAARP